jgi:hypothetical protein
MAMAEPSTYREVIEHVLAQTEQRVYTADTLAQAPPMWLLRLMPFLHRALDHNPLQGPRP